MNHALEFSCWVATDVGRRRLSHEDAVAVPGLTDPRPKAWASSPLSDGSWILIADGMGGHAAGEVASELAVTMLAEIFHQKSNELEITRAIKTVHAEIFAAAMQNAELRWMATTIAGVQISDNKLLSFNLGDSRIYHLGGAGLRMVTADHASEEGLFGYLGGSYPTLARNPDYHSIDCQPGEIILLCTDGLTNMVSDLEIEAILADETTNPAGALVEAALDAGGKDNVSVVVIGVGLARKG